MSSPLRSSSSNLLQRCTEEERAAAQSESWVQTLYFAKRLTNHKKMDQKWLQYQNWLGSCSPGRMAIWWSALQITTFSPALYVPSPIILAKKGERKTRWVLKNLEKESPTYGWSYCQTLLYLLFSEELSSWYRAAGADCKAQQCWESNFMFSFFKRFL